MDLSVPVPLFLSTMNIKRWWWLAFLCFASSSSLLCPRCFFLVWLFAKYIYIYHLYVSFFSPSSCVCACVCVCRRRVFFFFFMCVRVLLQTPPSHTTSRLHSRKEYFLRALFALSFAAFANSSLDSYNDLINHGASTHVCMCALWGKTGECVNTFKRARRLRKNWLFFLPAVKLFSPAFVFPLSVNLHSCRWCCRPAWRPVDRLPLHLLLASAVSWFFSLYYLPRTTPSSYSNAAQLYYSTLIYIFINIML